MEQGFRQEWDLYKERLESYGYTEEEISEVFAIRESYDLCPNEQFRELFLQGVVERIAKVKKPRHYYVNDSGEFLYLNHRNRRYEIAGKFKTEE